MAPSSSPRSRIPVRANSCPSSPKPRHISLTHSALITIHEGPQEKTVSPRYTRMPRVRSCDRLYQHARDKDLPHLPQPDSEAKIVPSTEAPEYEEVVEPITDPPNDEVGPKETQTRQSNCMITASEAAWQTHLLADQRARKWKLCTSVQTLLDQNIALLSTINISTVKAECLISLLNDISGNNQRLRYLHQRAVDQSRTFNQQTEQLANASKFVIKSNAALISGCSTFLKEHINSYDELITAKETTFLHATSTAPSTINACVPQNQDLINETQTLAVCITSLTTLLDALENINVLLLKHKESIEGQIVEFKTTMTELVQKKGAGGLSLLFKFSCFR